MYQPKYIITNRILKNIGQIEASKEVIENAPLVPTYEKQFQNDAFAKAIHHGTHIEGNELNLSLYLDIKTCEYFKRKYSAVDLSSVCSSI